jgi:hypothetical protein
MQMVLGIMKFQKQRSAKQNWLLNPRSRRVGVSNRDGCVRLADVNSAFNFLSSGYEEMHGILEGPIDFGGSFMISWQSNPWSETARSSDCPPLRSFARYGDERTIARVCAELILIPALLVTSLIPVTEPPHFCGIIVAERTMIVGVERSHFPGGAFIRPSDGRGFIAVVETQISRIVKICGRLLRLLLVAVVNGGNRHRDCQSDQQDQRATNERQHFAIDRTGLLAGDVNRFVSRCGELGKKVTCRGRHLNRAPAMRASHNSAGQPVIVDNLAAAPWAIQEFIRRHSGGPWTIRLSHEAAYQTTLVSFRQAWNF